MSLKIGWIYKATCLINGKSYIGKTINFKSRKGAHINGSLKKNSKGCFANALRKYGKQNFKWSILFKGECHPNKLNELEKFFIGYYGTYPPSAGKGYNMTPGGSIVACEYVGKLISKALNKVNPETGLSPAKIIAKKLIKTLNEIQSSGLTLAQEKAIKQSNTLNKLQSSGLTKAQEIGKKVSKTLLKNKSNSGSNNPCHHSNMSKERQLARGKNVSKTQKERKVSQGYRNPRAKKYLLIASNGQMIGCFGDFKKKCKKYNINGSRLEKFINKGQIPSTYYKNNQSAVNTTDWSIYFFTENHYSREGTFNGC